MPFPLEAAILGGSAIASSLIGRKSSGGGGGVSYSEVPETEEAIAARKKLYEMATGPLPTIPKRKIAPLEPMTPERTLARETATKALAPKEQEDFWSFPDVKAIIDIATEKSNLLANRVTRALQASGNITSTTAPDIMNKVVRNLSREISSALAPFAESQRGRAFAERQRIQNLIPMLESLGLTEEERGRGVLQSILDALYEQQTTETQLPFTYRKPLLESVIGQQPPIQPYIQGQKPSAISQLAPLIGPLLSSVLKGGSTETASPWSYGMSNIANTWLN